MYFILKDQQGNVVPPNFLENELTIESITLPNGKTVGKILTSQEYTIESVEIINAHICVDEKEVMDFSKGGKEDCERCNNNPFSVNVICYSEKQFKDYLNIYGGS